MAPMAIPPNRETRPMSDPEIQNFVAHYYGELLQSSGDLKTNACCATGGPALWLRPLLENVHPDVTSRFYGCGYPIPEALDGATVVDLGCGTGRDVYVLSQLVGQGGQVHGIDMTPNQLDTARETAAWHMDRFGFSTSNVAFHEAYIEDLSELPIADASVDVVVSNCVVNLSPRKDLVMREVARILKPGGEFYFADVFADRRLSAEVATDPVLYAECLGGAMYTGDFLALARRAGFHDPRVIEDAPLEILNDEAQAKVGAARFSSTTFRLFKLDGLEDACEDYGQIATYKGTARGSEAVFRLDDHHLFETGRPERVCGNTAMMLQDTRFAPHFDIVGDRSVHFGAFDCAATIAATQYQSGDPGSSACC